MNRAGFRNVAILLALQSIYLIWLLHFGRFMGGDEIAYKAAGREWERSGTFIAPELRGFGSWRDPGHPIRVAARLSEPPIYTFTFGVFVKIVGFGPTTIVAFDALITSPSAGRVGACPCARAGAPVRRRCHCQGDARFTCTAVGLRSVHFPAGMII